MGVIADRLRHVRWIGGGSGAGKSTIARRLAARHGHVVYATDDVMADHARRGADSPYLAAFLAMDMDERWLNRCPETMLDTFHWFRGECFDLIVEDLLGLPRDRPVIAEGFRLLPHLVAPLLTDRGQAVWLLPTPGFRRAALQSRGGLWQIAGRTTDPPRALTNLLTRDALFTDRLRAQTARLSLNAVEIGTGITEDDLTDRVAAALGVPV